MDKEIFPLEGSVMSIDDSLLDVSMEVTVQTIYESIGDNPEPGCSQACASNVEQVTASVSSTDNQTGTCEVNNMMPLHTSTPSEKPSLFRCSSPKCKYSSKFKYNVSRHERKHQNKKLECAECGTSYFDKYDLEKHQDMKHHNKSLLCEVCSKTFKSRSGLYEHKIPLICDVMKFVM